MSYPKTTYNNNTINSGCIGCYWHNWRNSYYSADGDCRNKYKCVNNEKYKNNY